MPGAPSRWALAGALAFVLSACGGAGSGGGAPAAAVTCSPQGTTVRIVAQNIEFDRNCIAVPANTPFRIVLDNRDSGVPHNLSIYTNSTTKKLVYHGTIFTGPGTRVEKVPGLAAGRYYFQCDVHPGMNGVLIVK